MSSSGIGVPVPGDPLRYAWLLAGRPWRPGRSRTARPVRLLPIPGIRQAHFIGLFDGGMMVMILPWNTRRWFVTGAGGSRVERLPQQANPRRRYSNSSCRRRGISSAPA